MYRHIIVPQEYLWPSSIKDMYQFQGAFPIHTIGFCGRFPSQLSCARRGLYGGALRGTTSAVVALQHGGADGRRGDADL